MQLYRNDDGDYPPIGSLDAFYAQYVGPSKLHCPAQTNPWIKWDYLVYGNLAYGPAFKGMERERIAKEYEECRDKRGPDFPVVWDTNHATSIAGYETGETFFIFARESGKIHRVPASLYGDIIIGRAVPICALELGKANL